MNLQALIDDAAARYQERLAAWRAEGGHSNPPWPEHIALPAGVYTGPVTLRGGVFLVGEGMHDTVISLDPTWVPPAPRPLWLIRLRSLRHYLPWL